MTEEEQLAKSLKYSSAVVWHFAEISPGQFALYDYNRQVVLITRDWNEVLQHYRERPAYIPHQKAPSIVTPHPDKFKGLVFKI
jgi:hypothetical protein